MIPGLTDRNADAAAIRSILQAHPGLWCAATPPRQTLSENPIMTCCCKAPHGDSVLHENTLHETWGYVATPIERVERPIRRMW